MKLISTSFALLAAVTITSAQQFFGSANDFHIENATFFGETEIADPSKGSFGSSSNVIFRNDLTIGTGTLQSDGKFTFTNTAARDIDGNIEVDDLEVTSGSEVRLLSNKAITVTNQLTNAGTFTVRNNAALVQTTGSGLTNSGTFNVQRTIPSHNGFRFIGSPINSHSVSGFGVTPSGTNGAQLQPIVGNCNPDSISPTSPFGNIQELRENATLIDNCSHSLWHVKSSGNLTNGRGYSMNVTAGQTLTFSGTVNNDNVSYSGLTRTAGSVGLPGGGTSTRGWHLVTNPYPSPIELTGAGLNSMGFDAQVQFWQPTGNFTGNWVAVDPLSTVNIAVGQAFQIRKTNVGGTSTFMVTNAMRNTGAATFFKAPPRQFFMNVTLDNGTQTDNTMVYFYPNATDDFDPAFDANRLQSSWSIPRLFTIASGEKMSYNAYEILQNGQSKSVPMGFHSAQPGSFKLTFTDVSTLINDNIKVMLEDVKLNIFENVIEGTEYQFTKAFGDDDNRFVLHFNKTFIISGVDNEQRNAIKLFPNPSTGLVNILSEKPVRNIEMFDALGRMVKSVSSESGSLNLFDMSELAVGVYHVSINHEKQNTQRIVKH